MDGEQEDAVIQQKKIIKQLEFYFGNYNLPKDKYLLELIKLDNGWIPIETISKFYRMQSICSDMEKISDACFMSNSDLIEVSEDGRKVRRKIENAVPVNNEEYRQELVSRTAFVQGFPGDDQLEAIEQFLEPYGPIEYVRLRRYQAGRTRTTKDETSFNGTIFVTFNSIETCKKFIELDQVKYNNDQVLVREWQADYIHQKRQERYEKAKNEVRQLPKGALLHMSGFGSDTEKFTIADIVTKINYGLAPAYINFTKGDTEGTVRFPTEGGAVAFVDNLKANTFVVDQHVITVRVLRGEEEQFFLTKISEHIQKMKLLQMHKPKRSKRPYVWVSTDTATASSSKPKYQRN